MDRRERLEDDINEAVLAALIAHQGQMWTALPGYVTAVNLSKQTVDVQTTVQARLQAPDGSITWINIPKLPDVPILFPHGGGFSLTFPVKVGDECLVIFSSRCIDAWWSSGQIGPQNEMRMHDLSDGFALIGPRSAPNVLSPPPNSDGVELRSDDDSAYIRIDSSKNITAHTTGNIAATASGSITATAPTISLVGSVSVTGSFHVNGKDVGDTHKHSGVISGGSNTGNPI